MKVIVYVEGKSDRLGMETLLRPLVEEKRQQGVDIQFYETPNGDRKTSVLTKVPIKAVNILRNVPDSVVVALPDLYPRNKGFLHETVDELVEGVTARPAATQCFGLRPVFDAGWGEPPACGRLSSRPVAPAGNKCRHDCRQQAGLPTPPARAAGSSRAAKK